MIRDQIEVSLLTLGVMLVWPQRLSASLQNGLCFFYPPLPCLYRLTLRFAFLISGEAWAYHVPHKYPQRLGLAYSPEVFHLRLLNLKQQHLTSRLLAQAYGWESFSIFGLFGVTMFIGDSLLLTILCNPSP